MKKKKKKTIFQGIRKPIAPPSKRYDTDKKHKIPKHKKPIDDDS